MNGCDYNHLNKRKRVRRSCTRNHYTLCAVSYPATETAECAFLNGFMVLVFLFLKHHSNVCNLHYWDLK